MVLWLLVCRDQAESTHVKQTFRYANSFVINGVLPHNCASYDLDKAEKASTRIRNHNPPNFSKTVGRDQVFRPPLTRRAPRRSPGPRSASTPRPPARRRWGRGRSGPACSRGFSPVSAGPRRPALMGRRAPCIVAPLFCDACVTHGFPMHASQATSLFVARELIRLAWTRHTYRSSLG